MSSESLCNVKFGRDVKPEPLHEPTFVNTVSKLIHRAVPQQSTVTAKEIERVMWVAFEKCDLNDPLYKSLLSQLCGSELPLVVVIGLCNGFQIWACMFNGDCVELLSVRDQPVSIVQFLPFFKPFDSKHDQFFHDRPLIAVLAHTRSDASLANLNILSLKSGLTVHTINSTDQIGSILSNNEFVIIVTNEKIKIHHAGTFEELMVIIESCLSNAFCKNSIALGSRWIAYPDCGISRSHVSIGGVSLEEPLHCNRFVNNMAKTVSKTVSDLSKSVSGSVVVSKGPSPRSSTVVDQLASEVGVVTVLDLTIVPSSAKGIRGVSSVCQGVIAHFEAHLDEKISCLAFAPNGTLLLTGGQSGREFHLFNILAHPTDSSLSAIHHLYTLHRGNTNAAVQDLAFAEDCRWLAITTVNGTTHVFPITSYGGKKYHVFGQNDWVVNRESRFERSSGVSVLSRHSHSTGRKTADSPNTKGGSPVVKKFHPTLECRPATYPSPVGVFAVDKVKPYECQTTLDPPSSECFWRQIAPSVQNARLTFQTRSACFAPIRGLRAINDIQAIDSHPLGLYTIGTDGKLCEFQIVTKSSSSSKNMLSSGFLEASLIPAAEWFLFRVKGNACVQPPLPPSHFLLVASDNVKSFAVSKRKLNANSFDGGKDKNWISEIEIVSYAGPHRRLWLGPQFIFKKYFDKVTSSTTNALSRGCKSEPIAIPCRRMYNFLPVVIQNQSVNVTEAVPEMTVEVCGSWSDNDYITQSDHKEALRRHIIQAMQEEDTNIECNVELSDDEVPELTSPSAIGLEYLGLHSEDDSTDLSSSSSCHERDAVRFISMLDL